MIASISPVHIKTEAKRPPMVRSDTYKKPGGTIVFVNTPLGTFTPTHSGAVATVIWETCRAAQKSGVEPWVISRCDPEVAAYPWQRLILIDPFVQPSTKLGTILARAGRKLHGHREMGHRTHARRVLQALRDNKMYTATIILNNDPDTARYLASHLPLARIMHHFHNQHTTTPKTTRMLAQSAETITGISRFTLDWAKSHYGLKETQVVLVPNGVNLEAFHPAIIAVDREVPVVSFLGRTGIEKGLDVLLQALNQIAKDPQASRFSVKVIGSNHWGPVVMDKYQDQLRRLAGDLEACGVDVHWTGHVPRAKVPDELRGCDIHVVPSRWEEPFGLTTLEGMACGLPVIATNTGGTPEVVGDAATLVPPDNPAALADAIRPLLASRVARREAGERSLRQAQAYTWGRVWHAWLEVLAVHDQSKVA